MSLSMHRWVNKVAIVTGASSGIGAAIAERLVNEGLQVVGFARRLDRVQSLSRKLACKKGKLHPLQVDITSEEDIFKAFKWIAEKLGPVHILVNNAGILKNTGLIDGNIEQWRNTIDTNVMGLCICTSEAIKSMKANNIDGHVIHISSCAGRYVPQMPNLNVYPATKHAITALTETLRMELNEKNLRTKITTISPGGVKSEITQSSEGALNPEIEKMMHDKLLDAEDIADSVVYVLSTPPHVQVHELIVKPVGERW